MPTYQDETGRWRYRFTLDGERYSGSAPKGNNTKRVAAELEKKHVDRAGNRRHIGDTPTIAQFATRFLAFQAVETKQLTVELQTRIVALHIVPHLGRLKLDRVTKGELDGLKTKWDCAPRTKNTRLGVVMRMLELAREWGLLHEVPRVKNVKVPKDTPRFLTEPEATALIETATGRMVHWRDMMIVALRTGMRIGELRGLRWGDIDFARRVLVVRRTDPGRGDMDPNAPKGNRPRLIPLTADALAALERSRAGYYGIEPTAWVWGSVERTSAGRTRSSGSCSHSMQQLAARAGFTQDAGEEVTWHTLRHTFASWLVMRGVSLAVVQELLGHASVRQTERYAHLAAGFAQHTAIAALDLPLLGSGGPSAWESTTSPESQPKGSQKPRRALQKP